MNAMAAVLCAMLAVNPTLAAAEIEPVATKSAAEAYFPDSFFTSPTRCASDDGSESTTHAPILFKETVGGYVSIWRAAGEPSLFAAASMPTTRAARTYRFTWARSFAVTIVVRIDVSPKGAMTMTAYRLTGHGGFGPDGEAERRVRFLSRTEAKRVGGALPARLLDGPPIDCPALGVDGAEWILEANDRGSYRYINRWSPGGGPMYDAGLTLLKLTGWPLDPIY